MKYFLVSGAYRRPGSWTCLARVLTILLALALLPGIAAAQTPSAKAPAVAPPPATSRHKIRTSDAALGRTILDSGGRLVADYGSYQLYEMPKVSASLAASPSMELHDEYNTVFLNAGALDTSNPQVQALQKSPSSFSGRRLRLLQFAGPVKPEWRSSIEAAGAKIIAYIPENTYLVYGSSPMLAQVNSLGSSMPQIQWQGDYLDAYKINPLAQSVDEKGNARDVGTSFFNIQLVNDSEANTNTIDLINQFSLAPIVNRQEVLDCVDLLVELPPGVLPFIAAQPDVVSITPSFKHRKFGERQDQIIAGNLVGNAPAGPGYLAWLAGKGFTQAQFTSSGFVVDVSDSGLDNGTVTPGHSALYTGGTTSLPSRVVYTRLQGSANGGSTLAGCDGHGTINTHIISGYDDAPTGFPHTDSIGYHYGLGVCPFVRVGSSVIFDPSNFTNPNYANLQSRAYQDGARISNNSWGSPVGGAYDTDAQAYDALVRDAQPSGSAFATSGNQGMVIVFASGNNGPGSSTIGSPGSAKNVITVGASENVQVFGGSDACDVADTQADNANDIVSFSSRGPCSDGRRKPDLVAPGSHVSGGVPQVSGAGGNGQALACFDAEGICGGTGGSLFFPEGQELFTASSGTSHSAPCVSGGCALLRQYFINNFTNPPSPAMTKAYLMNSARYLNGSGANDSLWSNSQGMGDMNLGTAFDGVPRFLRDQLAEDMFTASGQARFFAGTVANSSLPLRVTIAWTDAPGNTTGAAYNNNLDLTVTVGGNTYKGNVFGGPVSITGGTSDIRNNVESVFLPAGVSGPMVVTVTAVNINSDGVPNNGASLDQDFALVIYNATITGVPLISPGAATVVSENCVATNGTVDPGETVTMAFALQNSGSADTTNLVATLQATGGVLLPGASQSYGVVVHGGAPVTNLFTFTATNGPCGTNITATFLLQDGASSLGTVNFTIPTGKFASVSAFTESFDAAAAPALPAGWATSSSGSQPVWVTSASTADTLPNSAFTSGSSSAGLNELVSPEFMVNNANAVLIFRNSYNLEASSSFQTRAYDGGVLEINIDKSGFKDFLGAGGSFVSGGYDRTISPSFSSPLAGRQAWSGNSGGFITTQAALPASAAGKFVQFKWRCASDDGVASEGWYVDSVRVTDGGIYLCCDPQADLAITQAPQPLPSVAGNNLIYSISITNPGPSVAFGTVLTDSLPSGASFIEASPGCVTNGNTLLCNLGLLPVGGVTNLTVTVNPSMAGFITNVAMLSADTMDTNQENNISISINYVSGPPIILQQPTNQTTALGGSASFHVQVEGSEPLAYRWFVNNITLVGGTNDTLFLANVQQGQAGNYRVIVTNYLGSVTSSVVTLRVLVPPTVTKVTADAGGVSIYFESVAGQNYVLEYTDSLEAPDWQPAGSSSPGDNGVIFLSDPDPAATRFYRIRVE